MKLRSNITKRPYFFTLSFLLFLFVLRVAGQILVCFFHLPFLPPMQDWYSGLIPYPILLILQFMIIGLLARVCFDFAGLGGHFSRPDPKLALGLTKFGILYFASMLLRYALLMAQSSTQTLYERGCIPIFFHFVLASFLLVLATYHHKACNASVQNDSFNLQTQKQEPAKC